jgi:uncharacterized protein (DUF305 family)
VGPRASPGYVKQAPDVPTAFADSLKWKARGGKGGLCDTDSDGGLLVALLAASCTTSDATQPTGSDRTDVWFMQHMAGHLLQTTAVVDLAGDKLTRPQLDRLAETIGRQSHAHLEQLQGWLASRGRAS